MAWKTVRLTLLLGVVLMFVALVGLGHWRRGEQHLPSQSSLLRNRDCRACHPAVWAEWQQSAHAQAWSSPDVQAAFQHFGFDRKCQSCHAPEPVLVTGLTSGVRLRETSLQQGVTCLTCHQRPDGRTVAARRTNQEAPCHPVATAELTTSQFCDACHQSVYEDARTVGVPRLAVSCQECHMASEDGGRRSHLYPGSRDPDTIRSAATMECRQEGDQLVVAVTNRGAGHNFPGERHNRVLLVQVIQRNREGRITLAQQDLIKGITPFRDERSADQIRAGHTYVASFPVVEPPVLAEVRLLYKQFPWYSDRQALIVHEAMVELEKP